MTANGGYCDVFVGLIHSKPLHHRRILYGKDGMVRVAIKHLRARLLNDTGLAKTLAREISVWSHLDHSNILPFLGFMLENEYPSLISEWMELGTAREFLKSHPNFDITGLVVGVTEGLKYMHDSNIVHSDLKADNVLIGENWQPLICDFGISRMLDSSQSHFVSTTHNGSPRGSTRWMAIELYKPDEGVVPKHSKETDVWAFGMTLYEMMAKELPYAHLRANLQVLLAIMDGKILPTLPDAQISTNLPPPLYSMLRSLCTGCWKKNPKERSKMTQITSSLSSLRAQKPELLNQLTDIEHTRILASQQGVPLSQQPGPANAADTPGAATMSSMGFPNVSQQQPQTWMPQMNRINTPYQSTGGLPATQQMHGGPSQNGPAQVLRQHTSSPFTFSPFDANLGQTQQQQTPIPRSVPALQWQQM
ncbi:hypothetical protein ACEPAH_8095 [Sanghuangporus vaninii]